MTLENTHDDEESHRVHNSTGRDTVDKPLCQGVLHAELGLPVSVDLSHAFFIALLELGRILSRRHFNITDTLLRAPGRIRRKCALQELLPVIVRRGSDQCEGDEAEKRQEIQSYRAL